MRACVRAVHASSALGGCTAAADGDVEVPSAAAAAASVAAAAAAAAAVARATIAAKEVLGGGRSDGRRAAAVDGTTGSWNTFATRI